MKTKIVKYDKVHNINMLCLPRHNKQPYMLSKTTCKLILDNLLDIYMFTMKK